MGSRIKYHRRTDYLQGTGNAQATRDVLGPDGGAEAVRDRVGLVNHVRLIREGRNRHHGPKYFFRDAPARLPEPGYHGWLEIVALQDYNRSILRIVQFVYGESKNERRWVRNLSVL